MERKKLRKYFDSDLSFSIVNSGSKGDSTKKILNAIELLRKDVLEVKNMSKLHKEMTGSGDIRDLINEVRELDSHITEVKENVSLISHPEATNFATIANDWSNILTQIEDATNNFLDIGEEIFSCVDILRETKSDKERQICLDKIQEQADILTYACGFQDLTGQKINKIVNAFSLLEERIVAIINIWGEEELENYAKEKNLVVPVVEDEREDSHLLNGPLDHDDEDALSQDDIEALFAD